MMADTKTIKTLRDRTGISIMLCKQALENSDGDEVKAMEWLRQHGVEVAEKKSSRATKAGIVEAYIHGNGQAGVLVELRTETDFVAKNPGFKELAHNVAMQIVASKPSDVEELLEQQYIKNMDIKISGYLNEAIQKFGENIEIARFERISL